VPDFFLIYCQVRAEIAKVFDAKADCICMLYAGKILKNGETITQSNIQNGTTVNIVIRTSLPGVSQRAYYSGSY